MTQFIKRTFPFAISLGFAMVGGYLAFRSISLDLLVRSLKGFDCIWLIPAAAISLLSYVLRGLRWLLILSPISRVTFLKAFYPMMTGFMLNCILPARAGEIARPALLYRANKTPFAMGLATVAVERFFDMLCLMGMLSLIFTTIPPANSDKGISFGGFSIDTPTLHMLGINMLILLIIFAVMIVLIHLNWTQKRITYLVQNLPGLFIFAGDDFKRKISQKICNPLLKSIANFREGFSFFLSAKRVFLGLVLSFVIWYVQALSWYVLLSGFPEISMAFHEIVATMIIVCFFIALPSVPGFWGLWEAAGIFAMGMFNISPDMAAGYTLVNHALQIFIVIGAGLISAYHCGIKDLKSLFQTR